MLVGGIVLIVACVGLIIWHVLARRKAGELKTAKLVRVSNLEDLASRMAAEIGDGGLEEFCELSGQPHCSPLISPLGERECLHYTMTVERQYEETYYTKDSEGREQRRTRRGSEVMSRESDAVDFVLDDGSGQIDVHQQGADFDGLVETVDRFEPSGEGGMVRMGRWSISVGRLGSGRRTLGYKYREQVLPFGPPLTVIGKATDAHGGLSVVDGGLRFIISTRTRKEIIGSAEKVAKFTSIGSAICALVGIGLLAAHFLG